jgi:hypothetical protein
MSAIRPALLQRPLFVGWLFGKSFSTLAVLHPTALAAVLGLHLFDRLLEAGPAVGDSP